MRLLLFLFMIVNISYKFITYECCLSGKIKLEKKKHTSEFITTATKKISETFINKCDILSILD